ncbi:MAG: DUF481 domain-containing protein [Myxococcales bacterium]|nr:MAG: DUF481 domain-containing protein [Myxococcales bacterium]
MTSERAGARGLLPLLALGVAMIGLAGARPASAQTDVGAGLYKDESVPEGEEVVNETALEDNYMIEFGDEKDWIRLKSGEWLSGNLERMRDGALEFDSAELKLLTYDWKKVKELHSPKSNTYRLVDGTELVGPAMIDEETITVQTAEGIKTAPRDQLDAIIEHTRRERNYWSTVLRFGLTANAGNSENFTLNGYFRLMREDAMTRAVLSYDGTFGTASRVENANRHLGSGDVDVFVHPIVYVKALTGQLLYDKFQNVRLRATPAAGIGANVITTYKWNWDVEFAPAGYQYLSLLTAAAGVQNPQSDGYMMFRTFADLDFTDDIQLLLEWRTNLVYTTIGNTNHVGSLDFTLRITTILYFNTAFLYLRTEDPWPRADGTVPKKNDYQVVVGISLRLG